MQNCEEESAEITRCDILFLYQDATIPPPPQGLSFQISFLHESDEKSGILSRFPRASTCSCTIYLPVIHKTYEDFKEPMSYAVQHSRGFEMA